MQSILTVIKGTGVKLPAAIDGPDKLSGDQAPADPMKESLERNAGLAARAKTAADDALAGAIELTASAAIIGVLVRDGPSGAWQMHARWHGNQADLLNLDRELRGLLDSTKFSGLTPASKP